MLSKLITARRELRERAIVFAIAAAASAGVNANPQGPNVINGTANFINPNPQILEVTNSPGAIINWNSFDIDVGETTRFIQQSADSAVLNRVVQPGASQILGQLESNGRVFLINPTGIIIGRDAMVDTAGLVMSTLDISDEDFLAGKLDFSGGPDNGSITNHGYIKAGPGGEIILIAPSILNAPLDGNENSGLIEAENGELILAAGYGISISSLDDPAVSFEVQAPENEVVNLGRLLAQGGTASVLAGTIKHSGEINTDRLTIDADGRIVLRASDNIDIDAGSVISAAGAEGIDGGTVLIDAQAQADSDTLTSANVAGSIDVSGESGGSASIEADTLTVSAEINADGQSAGGAVTVLGDNVSLEAAAVSVSATEGDAGQILVGGDFQGQGETRRALRTDIDTDTSLTADASEAGDGGTVIVWSDERTEYRGHASARGGDEAGDGGLIEVSGKETLQFAGGADVGAPNGTPGTLLLDPRNIFIVQGAAETVAADDTPFAGDRLGATGLTVLPNGNILVVNQDADTDLFVDAGEILLLDPFGGLIGSVEGNATNERLGSFGSLTNIAGNRLFRSPNAANGALAQAGAVILFDINNGTEIGRTSGLSAGEGFGSLVTQYSNNFIVRSTTADVGGLTDAGSVVIVDGLTGLELGRVDGQSANEFFGQNINTFVTAPDTFVVRSGNADIGGQIDAGSVVLINALNGNELGRVEGAAANDRFGDTVDFFGVPNGTYLIRAANADVGGLTDNGTAILVNENTGMEIGRTSGLESNSFVGQFSPILRGSGNYFLRAPDATIGGNAFAGSVILVNGVTGTRIGSLDGNSVNEDLGLDVDSFSLGFNDILVTSTLHDNGGLADAGGIFVLADVDLGGGNIIRGQTLGTSANELFGNETLDAVGANAFRIASPLADPGGFADAGSVILIDRATGNELGRVDGASAGERLGDNGFSDRGNGNYFIFSPDADAGGVVDSGSVILASGTTGMEIGRFDGDTLNEMFGVAFDDFSLFSDDILIFSPGHAGSAGIVAQLAATDLGGGNILRGSVGGLAAGDLVGSFGADFLPSGNYVVRAPDIELFGNPGVGSVFVVDGTTGSQLQRLDGGVIGENFGATVDYFFNGFNDDFLIRSSINGGNFNGIVQFVDGATGGVYNTFTGNLDDEAGSDGIVMAANGNLILPMTRADVGGTDFGSLVVFDGATYATLGRVDGVSNNEQFGDSGDIDTFSLSDPDKFLVHTPDRDLAGGVDHGAVVVVSALTGAQIGIINGQEPNDQLGEAGFAQELANGDFLIFNPSADTAGGVITDAGAVVLGDGTSFSEKGGDGAGRFYGQSAGEILGDELFARERANGNYFVFSRFADGGGITDSGTLYLADGTTGQLIGQADGDTINEQFGQTLDLFTASIGGNSDILVLSPDGIGGGGTVVQVADVDLGGGNIIRGRVDGNAGGGLLENLGTFGAQVAPDGMHYFLRSPNADPGGVTDAGSIYFVDAAVGGLGNQLDGLSANERLGNNFAFTGSAGNLFINTNGNANAGRVIVFDSMGNIIGEASGNNPGEFLGSNRTFVGSDIWVIAPLHNNGGNVAAGGIFAIANEDLGGGNIIRNSILGDGPNDQLGSLGVNFFNTNQRLIRVPNADVGGLVDAGSLIMVDDNLNILGRTDGSSAGEFFSQQFQTTLSNGNILVRSPLADIGGNIDAGTVKILNGANGNLIGETSGESAGEFFGNFFPTFLGDGSLLFRSPDADLNGLVDAGLVIQVDPATGLEIARIEGVSAGERLGALSPFFLGGDRFIFRSPDADIDGIIDAGRLVFFSPGISNVALQPDLLFADDPFNDTIITTGTIEATLGTGATLILQANNDIIFQPGANIRVGEGSLVLQAGRTVKFQESTVILGNVSIVANESVDNGVIDFYRSAGTGDVIFDDARVVSTGNFSIDGQGVFVEAGLNADAVFAAQDVNALFENFFADPFNFDNPAAFALGFTSMNVRAERTQLFGSESAGGFAALASFGEFTVDSPDIFLDAGTGDGAHALLLGLGGLGDFIFNTCDGCGDQPIFTDPFLDLEPQKGFFIAGLFQEPTIDAILAMLNKEESEDGEGDENEEDEEQELEQCI